MVAVAVSGGGSRVVLWWLHSMAVAGGHMAWWWLWWLQWSCRGGMCGGGVHSDVAHAVTRAGRGGKCSGREGREAQQEACAVGKGRDGCNGHRGRGERG
jgi:hypothetical protein